MAISYATNTMTVNIAESISLNGVNRGSSTNFSIPDIKYVENGIITLSTAIKAVLVTGDSSAAKNVVAANIRYIRLTNLDTSYIADVRVAANTNEQFWIQIPPYKSFMLTDTAMMAKDDALASAGSFNDLESIFAEVNGGSGTMSLEYYIASI